MGFTFINLDELWDSAKGTLSIGSIKVTFDIRPNMTKKEWESKFFSHNKRDFAITEEGKIIMPSLGIL